MSHHLEGRVDLSAIDRSRLLRSLPTGSLAPLGSLTFPAADASLSQLTATGSEHPRSTSPSPLEQYAGRYLPSGGLAPTAGNSYAMMTSYRAAGHVPDAMKHMLPDMQQYWSAASAASAASQSDSYARYLLGNMYYPYLPYLPATESLALFAQNSASGAHMEAALQAQAVQHRIYDLQKEALFGQSTYSQGLYSHSHPYSPSGQIEATNLSMPSASRDRQSERQKEVESGRHDLKSEVDKYNDKIELDALKHSTDHSSDKCKYIDGSERTRGRPTKTEDRDKIKSSMKLSRTSANETKKINGDCQPETYLQSKLTEQKTRDNVNEVIILDSPTFVGQTENGQESKTHTAKELGGIDAGEHGHGSTKYSLGGPMSRSPLRHKRFTSPENSSKRSVSPERRKRAHCNVGRKKEACREDQDMPENLCIKDRDNCTETTIVSEAGKTLSNVTTSTVTVTSVLEIITTDVNDNGRSKASSMSPSQKIPSLSNLNTVTTYSLPYYHNLYARSQPQDGKRVHATTYVPEIGTISSPVAGAPTVINVVDTKSKLRDKIHSDGNPLNLNDSKSSTYMISAKPEGSKQRCKDDLSIPLFVETNERNESGESGNESKCYPMYSMDCNNRVCVQSDVKPYIDRLVSPSGSDGRFSELDKTVDLSISKSDCSKDNDCRGSMEETTKSSVISKCDSFHSPKTNENERGHIHELRKFHEKDDDCAKKSGDKRKACDLNHNSKEQMEMDASKKFKKNVPSAFLDVHTVITLTDSDESCENSAVKGKKDNAPNKTKTENIKEHISKDIRQNPGVLPSKHKSTIKPLAGMKDSADNDKNGKQTQHSDIPKAKGSVLKTIDGSSQSAGIPVGIAVARQRNIAPKLSAENDNKKNVEDTKKQHPVADVKPIRPLKVIRPSTKGCGSTVAEKRNELPANLIVTGGATPPGVFWPDDQASRQLAAQFLQTSHPMTPTSWYGSGAFQFQQNATTASPGVTQGSQMPFTVPAGYKLAQDSVTGQILFLPSGSDVFDSNRLFSGLPVSSQMTPGSSFVPPVLPSQTTTVTLPVAPTLFPGQQAETNRPTSLDLGLPTYPPLFNGSVMAGPEVTIKDDNLLSTTQANSAAIITPSIILTTGSDNTPVLGNQEYPARHDKTPGPGNHDYSNEKSKLISLSQNATASDMTVVPGQHCSYTFPSPTVPIVFNPTLLTTQTVPDQCPDVTQLKQDHASVQSRGTSPMLPASDSCNEDIEEIKSDDNVEEIVEVCAIDIATETATLKPKTSIETCKEIQPNNVAKGEVITQNVCDNKIGLIPDKINIDLASKIDTGIKNNQVDDQRDNLNYESMINSVECEVGSDIKANASLKSPKSARNLFTDLTEYNPFMDPQVLQAADGLELLSALAEKSAMVVNEKPTDSSENISADPTQITQAEIVKNEENVVNEQKTLIKVEVQKTKKDNIEKRKLTSMKAEEVKTKHKAHVKCGFAFKPKKERKKTSTCIADKVTTFCGISIPEDEEVIDSIENEMKMRLAELQKRYREKQKQLVKLTPKNIKDSENKGKDDVQLKQSMDTFRGPGRPKKTTKTTAGSADNTSEKSCRSKVSEHGSKPSPPHTPGGSSPGQHAPAKKKKLAEMMVDRVFRKTASSFKIPLSKKINLIAPARIEFPGGSTAIERNEHSRHNKSLDFGKLIKRSRLSQINGKESGFVGGLWHRKYGSDKKHSLHKEIKLKKRKREHVKDYSDKSGLNLLAEYATKSSTDVQKRKRKSDELNGNMSPDSPNKKRKPGRPKKCGVVRPGVTETIVVKQSKHMDFFRWQTDEPKQERIISLDGKTPLKPLYLDEWNVRRSERIFLSDPSPQTSPNAVSPGVKPKPEATKHEKDKTPKHDKPKKSQSINLSQKVKKKYSTNLSLNKSREKTTELLKATRDRLTQRRQEKKLLLKSSCTTEYSDSDDIPLSLFKPKPKVNVEQQRCALMMDQLCDGMRILVFMDGLFHEGELKAIRAPDVYGAILDNERKTRPHYYSQEEILKEAIKDTKPVSGDQLTEGTRICAYWSQQFSCLYPGTISRGSPNPSLDRSFYNVEFDDGDTGKIPLDHIRIIPQDFPHVEYDPNPLLLLTKRRRTMSTSESTSSEPKKSLSEVNKDCKGKRGPGRPPKAERLMSNESIGDEDVFLNDSQKQETDKKNKTGSKNSTEENNSSDENVVLFRPRDLWAWSGSFTKRPGMKGKAKKEYYKTVTRGKENISVGECAVFLSTGRPSLPYVGRIDSFWEGWGGQMVVKVKWFYHPEETKGGKRLQNMKGGLFRSDHEDENDVQTISHKCEVIPYTEFRRRIDVISHEDTEDVYYLAGSYEPTIGHVKFEPGVV